MSEKDQKLEKISKFHKKLIKNLNKDEFEVFVESIRKFFNKKQQYESFSGEKILELEKRKSFSGVMCVYKNNELEIISAPGKLRFKTFEEGGSSNPVSFNWRWTPYMFDYGNQAIHIHFKNELAKDLCKRNGIKNISKSHIIQREWDVHEDQIKFDESRVELFHIDDVSMVTPKLIKMLLIQSFYNNFKRLPKVVS